MAAMGHVADFHEMFSEWIDFVVYIFIYYYVTFSLFINDVSGVMHTGRPGL